jgi:UDP-N-acetylmuramoyl-tripeptide--D-alanyl-D-alanine ligase
MKAALNTVLELYGDITIVLGDMGELGANEEVYHREVGDFINKKNKSVPKILTVGKLAKNISDETKVCFTKHFETNEEVARYILANIELGTTIFLKASRSMKLEEILEKLKESNK